MFLWLTAGAVALAWVLWYVDDSPYYKKYFSLADLLISLLLIALGPVSIAIAAIFAFANKDLYFEWDKPIIDWRDKKDDLDNT